MKTITKKSNILQPVSPQNRDASWGDNESILLYIPEGPGAWVELLHPKKQQNKITGKISISRMLSLELGLTGNEKFTFPISSPRLLLKKELLWMQERKTFKDDDWGTFDIKYNYWKKMYPSLSEVDRMESVTNYKKCNKTPLGAKKEEIIEIIIPEPKETFTTNSIKPVSLSFNQLNDIQKIYKGKIGWIGDGGNHKITVCGGLAGARTRDLNFYGKTQAAALENTITFLQQNGADSQIQGAIASLQQNWS